MNTSRVSRMSIPKWLRWGAPALLVVLLVTWVIDLTAGVNDYDLAQKPLYLGQAEPPLMMMVMSRDERLFTKAYSDYTDLNGDGTLDTTYLDTFTYEGYFDPKLCYSYSTQFKAAAAAGGANGHSCSGQWSGNFLNWVTMSRLDILRYVLYGGNRSVDSTTQTVLERAHIPNDLHAWVKVYRGSDIGQFTPLTGVQSFCNASHSANGVPEMRYAGGDWSEWASTSLNQCRINYNSDTPAAATSRTVRVEVCDPAASATTREFFCSRYGSSYKPAGLLQNYGESNRLRFGLISGSYSQPRSGGILRRNIGRFAGNSADLSTCAAGDEINLATGQFCNQGSGTEGIVNTISRFKLTTWNGWTADSKWSDCGNWGILNRQGQTGGNGALNNPGTGASNCSAWGNPMAEMYAEALRYIAGETSATAAFAGGADLAGLPAPTWRDPYRLPSEGGNSYCANCNILVMSSGLPSFDSDDIPAVPRISGAIAGTNIVGANESISGTYQVGRVGATPRGASLNTHEDICSGKTVGSLSEVRGICPDIPSLEGSYMLAGLAQQARVTDMRPGLQGKPADHRNIVNTYAVALADNLPKFDIPLGDGKISLAPLCQANGDGGKGIAATGWRTCALGSVGIGTKRSSVAPHHVYGRDLQYDAGGRMVAGSFGLVWEDSLWGNDNDNDVVSMLSFCVGSTCSADTNPNNGSYTGYDICWRSDSAVCGGTGRPTVSANEVLIRVENLSAYAGNAMLTGFAVTGSNNDGVHRLALRPGSSDGSVLTSTAEPRANWAAPKVMRFTVGSGSAQTLESPLWYAAKYGGFKDKNENWAFDGGDEWDTRVAGTPDNYFFARDPGQLRTELERIFEAATISEAITGGTGAGSRIGDSSFTVEAGFLPGPEDDETDWIGYLRGIGVDSVGGRASVLWDAAAKMPAYSARRVFTVTTPTELEDDGSIAAEVEAVEFQASNLGTTNALQLQAMGVPSPRPSWLGASPAAQDLVDYVKGRAVSGYRTRSSRLGDIVNSQPVVVMPRNDYGYAQWSYGAAATPTWRTALGNGYRDYLVAKRTSDQPMVYVGANDGMLHAFNGRPTADGGGEVFAFIPSGSRQHLYELANPSYEHKYFVDGPVVAADVSFSSAGAGDWRTVLVGTTGAGGASHGADGGARGHGSVFALDVTNPSAFDGDDVLWELSGESEDDLGFVLGRPVVVPIKGAGGEPRWVAMFGNGPNSTSGKPVLYVVDIATGQVLARLQPDDSYAGRNGLMNIAAVALDNNDRMADTVYAGDLQGNLWKFDLRSESPASWNVAYSGAPLFTAEYGSVRQPITGGIQTSRGPGGGMSIFFGTGTFFAEGDGSNDAMQTFYGIWDNLGTTPIAGRDELVGQDTSALGASYGYDTRGVGPVPATAVNYSTKRGWYMDLGLSGPLSGERFIGTPRVQSGKIIFTTYEPGVVVCSAGGGNNWLYALDLLNGTGAMAGISITPGGDPVCTGNCGGISLNKDGNPGAPVTNTSVFVPKLEGCDPADPDCTVDELLEAEQCTFVLRAAGADPLYMPRPCGRQSWRQVR